ncbi:MAG TPA: EpsG family protein [Brumimicrobium sp.]|nr:EpsG family protein [Brumimicrobium sp.]
MIPFLFLSILLLGGSFTNRRTQSYLVIAFGFILFILAGFRSISVGTDTEHYKQYFDIIESGYFLPVEVGWVYLNKLIIFLGGDFQSLLIVTSAITIFPIVYILRKYSYAPMFSLFLYYNLYIYFYSFNISRQTLAVTLVFVAIVFLLKNKSLLYLLFVGIATLFHTTALVALPLFFVNRIPDKTFIYVLGICLTALLGLLLPIQLAAYLSIFGYANYFENYEFGNVVGNALMLVLLNGFFFFVLMNIKVKDINFKIYFVFILISNLLARVPFNGRIVMFFSIFLLLFFPYFIQNSKIKEKPLLYFIITLYALVMFFRSFGAGEILPYENVLFNI